MKPAWDRLPWTERVALELLEREAGQLIGDTQVASGTKVARIDGALTADDPPDPLTKAPHKVHRQRLLAGKVYKIEMHTAGGNLDPLLRLEDAKSNPLALDDDGAGFPNARIVFKPAVDGEYRIITTAYPATGQITGKYTLSIDEIDWKQFLAAQVMKVAERGPNLTLNEAQEALSLPVGLEHSTPTLPPTPTPASARC